MTTENKPLALLRWLLWPAAAALLCLPALAMRFAPDAGVDWSAMDFVLMAAMLASACAVIEFGARRAPNLAYLAGVAVAAGTAFVTTWANLAVGMIGDAGDPRNLLFLGVLAIAALGALLARFGAPGLARATLAAGSAQAAIGLLVVVGGWEALPTALLIGAFALPWFLAAGLFRAAVE